MPLTPVLSAHWDEADSLTIDGYRRHGGYGALRARHLASSRTTSFSSSRTPAFADEAALGSRPA